MPAKKIAIACQGGGAHTAFTAGVLIPLLQEHHKPDPAINIVALSGTSGGAICALLAWFELLVPAKSPSERSRLTAFWSDPYPEGNASAEPGAAWLTDLVDFTLTGRLPWQHLTDSLRTDFIERIKPLIAAQQNSPLHLNVDSNPYFFHRLFELLGPPLSLAPPASAIGESAAFWGEKTQNWWQNFFASTEELLNGSALRHELDVQTLFRSLLERHLSGADIEQLTARIAENSHSPKLLVGAVDVLKAHPIGQHCLAAEQQSLETNFKTFHIDQIIQSKPLEEARSAVIDAVLASTALPLLMRAVPYEGSVYWDGLYASNPPIVELPDIHGSNCNQDGSDNNPDEIWVIRINPMTRSKEPDNMMDILDRRNELAGNIALMQEVRTIQHLNGCILRRSEDGPERRYKTLAFKFIDLPEELAPELMYGSKNNRQQSFLTRLLAEGESRGRQVLDSL